MDSIDTRQEQRDAHIRSADFFDVGNHTEHDLPLHRRPHRRCRLDRRRRADHQGHHQAGHPGARAQRLRPGRLRRHARRLHAPRPRSPARVRRRHRRCRWTAAASSSATRSTSSSRSRPCSAPPDPALPEGPGRFASGALVASRPVHRRDHGVLTTRSGAAGRSPLHDHRRAAGRLGDMSTSTLVRTRFPSAVLVAVGLAAGFGIAQGTGDPRARRCGLRRSAASAAGLAVGAAPRAGRSRSASARSTSAPSCWPTCWRSASACPAWLAVSLVTLAAAGVTFAVADGLARAGRPSR